MQEKYFNLILKNLTGEACENDLETLESWRKEDASNDELWQFSKAIWQVKNSGRPHFDSQLAFRKLRNKCEPFQTFSNSLFL